jgi:MFS family permease
MGNAAAIRSSIPARLDRLPWSGWHWRVVIALGVSWLLDGLEVTVVGALGPTLGRDDTLGLSAADVGWAGSAYIAGAVLGALFFGRLADRLGRKRMFLATLVVYLIATVLTGLSFDVASFAFCRFLTGFGIGGEYAAINSAIDELIPARVRGRVDLIINGSYWVGAAVGSAVAILLLNEALLSASVGWRLAFLLGAVIGLGVLVVRRNVPESPRWLFIHGREDEAEAIVRNIEQAVERETGEHLEQPDKTITVRQREKIPFREIAKTAFQRYPRRAILGLALFIGQAFLYNGVTFNLGTLYTTFFGVSSSFVPVFLIVFAAGNFLGPLLLGRLFDTVGRKPMIAGTYLGSAAVAALLAVLFTGHALGR